MITTLSAKRTLLLLRNGLYLDIGWHSLSKGGKCSESPFFLGGGAKSHKLLIYLAGRMPYTKTIIAVPYNPPLKLKDLH